jgi:hypothetical protein
MVQVAPSTLNPETAYTKVARLTSQVVPALVLPAAKFEAAKFESRSETVQDQRRTADQSQSARVRPVLQADQEVPLMSLPVRATLVERSL